MKFRFNISRKIAIGFAFIISITIVFGFVILNTSTSIVSKFSEEVDPSLNALNEFDLLLTKSKMYITNWVYLPSNFEDKEALKKIQEVEYREIKNRLLELIGNWHENDRD